MANDIEKTYITIAGLHLETVLPKDLSLEDRLSFAMRYVREKSAELFWMCGKASDDLKLQTALFAVMVSGTKEEKELLEASMKPLKMLAAVVNGLPVNMDTSEYSDNLIPIIKLWFESGDT